MNLKSLWLLPLCLILVQCSKDDIRKDMTFAGNKFVTAKELTLGKRVYQNNCMACHGENGEGNGVASKGLFPPPRNFKLGVYKFGKVMAGELLHDDTLKEIITKGLHGTAMLPWDIRGKSLDALVQYIKFLAPQVWEGGDKTLGKKVKLVEDPYKGADQAMVLEKGKAVFHVVANCAICHPAYATKKELDQYSRKYLEEPMEDFPEDLYKIKLQDWEGQGQAMPLDFTFHQVRSASSVKELAYRIAAGIGGAGMPPWKDTIKDEEIWAVAHYVRSLMDLRVDAKKKEQLVSTLRNQ